MNNISIKKMQFIIFVFLSVVSTFGQAVEYAVIVNPSEGINALTRNQITKIFLVKSKKFPNGNHATPISQSKRSEARKAFIYNVIKRTQSNLKSYFSRLIFTGKGKPPKQKGKDKNIKKLIKENTGLIGYINKNLVDDTVKVVFTF